MVDGHYTFWQVSIPMHRLPLLSLLTKEGLRWASSAEQLHPHEASLGSDDLRTGWKEAFGFKTLAWANHIIRPLVTTATSCSRESLPADKTHHVTCKCKDCCKKKAFLSKIPSRARGTGFGGKPDLFLKLPRFHSVSSPFTVLPCAILGLMEKGPVLSDGMWYQALQRNSCMSHKISLAKTHLILSRFHWQLCFFFWTWEQKAQSRWIVKKDSEKRSVFTAYYYC